MALLGQAPAQSPQPVHLLVSMTPVSYTHLDGDVRARADGDADVRAGERRGVVDTVADHGHLVALLLQTADDGLLLRGQHVGNGFADVQLFADGLGGLAVVAGEHDHVEAHLAEMCIRDRYLAVGGRVQAVDAADERGLARAAHTDDAVYLALFDLQTHAAEGHDLAPRHGIDLFQIPQFDQRLRHGLFILSRSAIQKPLRMIAKRQRSTIPQRISGNTNHTRRQPARLDIRMANCFIT